MFQGAPAVVSVLGATAVGKSDLAVSLALAIGAEVVNADAMQCYRGMDVGTAKLPPAQRRGVPHHLLDVWDVTQAASVAEYQRLARAAVDDIRGRGRAAVVVGGSGLYVRAVLERLDFPGTDTEVRARLEAELAADGAAALHARLAVVDPVAASSILPSNGRRIVRALEVVEITGRPFTATLPDHGSVYEPDVRIGLTMPREALDRRIADRVDRMWDAGLVDEVRALATRGLRDGPTASRALGYRQVLDHLAGRCTEQQARDETVRATRRFARRQQTWFGRDPAIHWLPVPAVPAAAPAADPAPAVPAPAVPDPADPDPAALLTAALRLLPA